MTGATARGCYGPRVTERASRRLPRRLAQLYAGLLAFAFGEAMIVRADLGVMSWDVLHQGLARHLGLSIGQWSVIVGALVLLLWIPLRERPGLGTVSNVVVIGLALDVFLALAVGARVAAGAGRACWSAGICSTASRPRAYVGARLGPGPRDGLMTGLVRTHRPAGRPGPDGDRGLRRPRRLAARRQPRRRDGPVRPRHRAAGPRVPAAAHRRRAPRRALTRAVRAASGRGRGAPRAGGRRAVPERERIGPRADLADRVAGPV